MNEVLRYLKVADFLIIMVNIFVMHYPPFVESDNSFEDVKNGGREI